MPKSKPTCHFRHLRYSLLQTLRRSHILDHRGNNSARDRPAGIACRCFHSARLGRPVTESPKRTGSKGAIEERREARYHEAKRERGEHERRELAASSSSSLSSGRESPLFVLVARPWVVVGVAHQLLELNVRTIFIDTTTTLSSVSFFSNFELNRFTNIIVIEEEVKNRKCNGKRTP
jgi:hypothetical protein